MSEKTPQAGYEAAQSKSSEQVIAAFENELLAAQGSMDEAKAGVEALNFKSDAIDRVHAAATLREATAQHQSEINSMGETWATHGGNRIDAARAAVDALSFRSDALAHASARAELRDAEDAWSASYTAAETEQSAEVESGDASESQPDLSAILAFGRRNDITDEAFNEAMGGDASDVPAPIEPNIVIETEPSVASEDEPSAVTGLGEEIILTNDMPLPEVAKPIGTKDTIYKDVYYGQQQSKQASETAALPMVEASPATDISESGDRLSLMQELKVSGLALLLHNRMNRFFEGHSARKAARREKLGDEAFEEQEKQREVLLVAGLGVVGLAGAAISMMATKMGASTDFLSDTPQMSDIIAPNDDNSALAETVSSTPDLLPTYQLGAHDATKGEGWIGQLEQMNIPREEHDAVMKKILETNDPELRSWVYRMDDGLPGISHTGKLTDSVLKSIEKLR